MRILLYYSTSEFKLYFIFCTEFNFLPVKYKCIEIVNDFEILEYY